jgi:hypothetical protein
MSKLSKNQRDQLIAVAVGAAAVMACLWYVVVRAQGKELAKANTDCAKMMATISDASKKTRAGEATSLTLTNCLALLRQREVNFAPEHEPYYWMMETLRAFYMPGNSLHPYRTVTIGEVKPPEITDKGVIAGFPYKWARFHITGEGRYHDMGKFIADLENTFPYFRVQDIDVAVPGVRRDADMLAFSFDLVTPQMPIESDTK